MKVNLTLAAALLLTLLVAIPGLGSAEVPRDMALGFAGEIYVARSGTCSELFDDCAQGQGGNPLLAIDVLRAGEDPVRMRVPGTDNATSEGIPTVFFEDASQVLYVVWEGKTLATESLVNLAWRAGGEWSTVEVSGNREPLKGPPRVAITRDSFEIDGLDGGEPTTHERSVVHIAWSEQAEDTVDFYYTPIILEDSAYLGANHVFNLSQGDPNPPAADPQGIPATLLQAPRLTRGREANSVVLAFANPASERFLSFKVQVVPASLSLLAEEVAAALGPDRGMLTPETLGALADKIRTHIVDVGHRLHPALLSYLADEIHSLVLGTVNPTPAGAPALGERIRTHIVDVGARMIGSDGLGLAEPSPVDLMLPAVPRADDGSKLGLVHHEIWVRLVSDRPAPAVGSGPTWIFVSEDGTKSLVSWVKNGNLFYRETEGDGWTGVRKIELDGPIDAELAERILRQRVEGF